MRKEYVKPVMESEEFVSNEYVASCYTITSTYSKGSCGNITGKNDDYEGTLSVNSEGVGVYYGKIGESNGCTNKVNNKDYNVTDISSFLKWLWDVIWDNTTTTEYFHPVSYTDGYKTSDGKYHPNASV